MLFHLDLDLASNGATGFCCLFVCLLFVSVLLEMLPRLGITQQEVSDRELFPVWFLSLSLLSTFHGELTFTVSLN